MLHNVKLELDISALLYSNSSSFCRIRIVCWPYRYLCSYKGLPWYLNLIKTLSETLMHRDTHHVLPFIMFSSCNSTAHKMFSPNKQAHQEKQIKPTCESNWWDWFREIQDQQRKQAFIGLSAGPAGSLWKCYMWFTNIVKCWVCLLGRLWCWR